MNIGWQQLAIFSPAVRKTNEKYFADTSVSGILREKKIDIQAELPYILKIKR